MKDSTFKDFVLDQMAGIEGVSCRQMFGGWGLYLEGHFFGIVAQDVLYFKTNETTRQKYLDAGMEPFQPNPKQTLKNYYQVPENILENPEELAGWLTEAAIE